VKEMIVILSALLLLTQGAAGGDHPGRGPGRGPLWGSGRGPTDGRMVVHRDGPYSAAWIADAGVSLTTDQRARIRTLEEKYVRQFEPLQTRLFETGKELKTEWLKTEPDRRKIEALQGEVAKLHGRIREKLADRRAEALEILSAEQRARLDEAEQRGDMRHDRIRFRSTEERR
jgi:Spy/CpxP family protein refolding chaperone